MSKRVRLRGLVVEQPFQRGRLALRYSILTPLVGASAAVPAPALRMVLGTQTDLVLHGRRASPEVAIGHGYVFRYPTLEDALGEALA